MIKAYSLTFLALVSLGGALGACSRYVISTQLFQLLGREFPYGTLAVNIIGSCIMGGLMAALGQNLLVSETWRPLVTVGFLGAFTTFSTFSMDNVMLLEQEAYLKAFINTLLNVSISIGICYLCFYLVAKR